MIQKLSLYVRPDNPADSAAFRGFSIGDRFAPGSYELAVDRDRKRWHLQMSTGAAPDSGGIADSLGKALGFKWILAPELFNGSGTRKIPFTVKTPRETALDYINNRLFGIAAAGKQLPAADDAG